MQAALTARSQDVAERRVAHGDDIQIGDITKSTVAVGEGATATVYNVEGDLHVYNSKEEARDRRNKLILLQKVRDFWIKGVLERSVHGAALFELGMETQQQAVAHPWDVVIETPDGEGGALPPGKKVLDIFEDMGRALLILGAPGAGKTITLLELARDALARAENDPNQPIPVVFNLSSWARGHLSIVEWLVGELNVRYQVSKRVAGPWVEHDDLLLLLDGLDEVRPERREACVEAINQFRREHGLAGVVVCSRTQDYLTLDARLKLGGAVTLRPLTPEQIDGYLAALGPSVTHLSQALQQDGALRELAASPLLLSIMLLTYRDQPAEGLSVGGSAEARSRRLFAAYVEHMFAGRMFAYVGYARQGDHQPYPREQTIRWLAWLARALVRQGETVFQLERLQPDWLPTPTSRVRYAVVDRLVGMLAGGLLLGVPVLLMGTLAGVLTSGLVGGLALGLPGTIAAGFLGGRCVVGPRSRRSRWRVIRDAILSWLAVGLAGGMTYGLVGGLVGGPALLGGRLVVWLLGALFLELLIWLPAALVGGLVGGPGVRPRCIVVVESLTWSRSRALRSGAAGLALGLVIGLVFGLGRALVVGLPTALGAGLANGLVIGLVFGLPATLVGGLAGGKVDERAFPGQGIWRSARTAILVGLTGGLALGLTAGLVIGLAAALVFGLSALVFGLFLALVFGLPAALSAALSYGGYACVSHLALRVALWRSGLAPLDYVRFLDFCVERIFLQRVGGSYIFIHRLLMEYFASLDPAPQEPS